MTVAVMCVLYVNEITVAVMCVGHYLV